MTKRKILLLAGEESGCLYAERLKARLDGCEVRGYADYGFKTGDLAVMGLGPVLMKAFYFMRVKRALERAILEWRPDVVCTIDYPGMNLRLAAFAKRHGVRAVHVVCPQVWAWKRGRIPKIEASLDRLCCFFPFEPMLFRPSFAEFVGHPLAEEFVRESTGKARTGDRDLLAVLPGSRLGEIEKILPTLLAAVRQLRTRYPNLKVAIPAANDRAYRAITRLTSAETGITVQRGGARALLRTARAAAVASGTATLEAALAHCPTVLVYRVGWLFATIARRVITGVKHIGLANVIAEKAGVACPMPELLQENMTTEAVVRHIEAYLADGAAHDEAVRALADVTARLSTNGDAIGRIRDELMI